MEGGWYLKPTRECPFEKIISDDRKRTRTVVSVNPLRQRSRIDYIKFKAKVWVLGNNDHVDKDVLLWEFELGPIIS
jgi:hypothetical protein